MAFNHIYLTVEGLAKAKAELEELRTVKRLENEDRLREAIALGDLSENSEYDAAKDEQARIASRILELEQMVNGAVLITETGNFDRVALGSIVEIEDLDRMTDERFSGTFKIVGTAEADPLAGKISDVSPVGKAIIGKKSGAVVDVSTPGGQRMYRIVKIVA